MKSLFVSIFVLSLFASSSSRALEIKDGSYKVKSALGSFTLGNNDGACHPDVVQRPYDWNTKPGDYVHMGVFFIHMTVEVTAPDASTQYWDISHCLPSSTPTGRAGWHPTLRVGDNPNFPSGNLLYFAAEAGHESKSRACRTFEKHIYPSKQFEASFLKEHQACMALQTLIYDQLIVEKKPFAVEVKAGVIEVPTSL